MDTNTMPLPKTQQLHPLVEDFLVHWLPNTATTKWSTGGGGCWIKSPLEALEADGHYLPRDLVDVFAARMRADWVDRGIMRSNFMEAGFDELAANNDPADGPRTGDNAWDYLHFGAIALLDDLHSRGYAWAGDFAMRLVTSYYNNKNTPWLRDAGVANKYMLYGDKGRGRTAGWICHALLRSRRITKRAGFTWHTVALENLLKYHRDRILEAMPFVEEPQGDSPLDPSVKHWRVFMIGILLSALRRMQMLSGQSDQPLMSACDRLGKIIRAACIARGEYLYDMLAVDDEPANHPNQLAKGNVSNIAGVGIWLCDALEWGVDEYREELRAAARTLDWPNKQPILWAAFAK